MLRTLAVSCQSSGLHVASMNPPLLCSVVLPALCSRLVGSHTDAQQRLSSAASCFSFPTSPVLETHNDWEGEAWKTSVTSASTLRLLVKRGPGHSGIYQEVLHTVC